jgi:hypothetical protein
VFVGRRCALFVAVRQHDRGVHVQHHHTLPEAAAGGPCRWWPTSQLPHPGPGLRPRLGDPPGRCRVDLVQRPPARSRRGHRAEHFPLVAQRVDVGDSFTTACDHDCQVGQHPATVMARPPAPPGQRGRQVSGQPAAVGQHPQQRRTRMRHHTRTVRGDAQPLRPRRRLHFEGAPSVERTVDLAVHSFPYRRGTFAYLHADDRPHLTIIA